MKRFILFLLLIAISFICACSTMRHSITENTVRVVKPALPKSAHETRKLLIGKWFGEVKTDDGSKRQLLLDRLPDGTYKIIFRTYKNDSSFKDECEVGLWGFSGSIFFSMMRGWIDDEKFIPADPTDPYYYDAYEILMLTERQFEYRHIPTNKTLRLNRVSDDYRLSEGK